MKGIQIALEAKRLTNTDLANMLGIAKQNISRWISGERKIPEKYLDKLQEILLISKENLLTEYKDAEIIILRADIYRNLAALNNDEDTIQEANQLRALTEIAIVKQDLNNLLDEDSVDKEEIFEILENISLILKLNKMNFFTLQAITETFLFNMESKTEIDEYIRTFKERDLPKHRLDFEKKLLNLISEYEKQDKKYNEEND